MSIKLLIGTHRNGKYVKGLKGDSRGVFESIALFAWTHWGYDNSQDNRQPCGDSSSVRREYLPLQ